MRRNLKAENATVWIWHDTDVTVLCPGYLLNKSVKARFETASVMLVTTIYIGDFIKAPVFKCWWQNHYFAWFLGVFSNIMKSSPNKLVTNIECSQHPSMYLFNPLSRQWIHFEQNLEGTRTKVFLRLRIRCWIINSKTGHKRADRITKSQKTIKQRKRKDITYFH